MKKTGIFYGSTNGDTESVANKIAIQLGIGKEDVHNVADTTPHAVQPYEVLLLGCSTWGVGEMQDDWNDFLFKLKDMDLKTKPSPCSDAEIRSVLVPVFVMLWVSSITSFSTPVVLLREK